MLSDRRIRTLIATGFVCVFVTWSSPARSQEAELKLEDTPIEATIPEGVDPKKALTTEDPTIPVDQLKLLVKPFTLEELNNEAVAWLLLLKDKVQEISNTEIAIKRENKAIEAQEGATDEVETAKKTLEEAEQAQKNAAPGSSKYEEATKKVEEARKALKKAQEAIEEAVETKAELKEDEALQEVLKEAQKEGGIEEARQVLEQAEKEREELTAGSPKYEQATEKINNLKQAISDLEKAEEDQKAANPDSPEYQEATQKIEQARAAVTQAKEAIASGTKTPVEGQPEETTELEEDLEEAASALEETEKGAEVEDLGDSESQKTEKTLEETVEKLEKTVEEDSELKKQLVVNVTELQSERTAIIDRFKAVLDEMDVKGGDTKPYRKYIKAVSKVEIDLTDTEGLGVRILSWATSEEGGLRWAKNLGTFASVMILAMIAAQSIGAIVNSAVGKVSNISDSLRQLIVTVIKRGVIFIGILMALSALEVSLGPILALLGGASFILAFALQNSIGNFANGLMLMIYKPFDVGDEIEFNGLLGEVNSLSLASTKIKTFGEQIVIIPSETIWSSTVINNTKLGVRAVGPTIKACDTSLGKIQAIFEEIFKTHPLILEEKSYIYPWDFEESSVIIEIRAYTETKNRWDVYEELLKIIQERFKKERIAIGVTQDLYVTYTPDLKKKEVFPEKLNRGANLSKD